MARNRMKSGLAATLVLFMGTTGMAQGLEGMHLFATVDQSRYGGGHRPAEGYFFAFDGLYWNIESPEQTDIGFDGLTRNVVNVPDGGFPNPVTFPLPVTVESSSLNTGFMETKYTGGTRYDWGHISGHHGLLFSAFELQDFNHRAVASNASVVFQDAPLGVPIPVLDASGNPGAITSRLQGFYDADRTVGGDLPVRFDHITVENHLETWGIEGNYMYRMHPNRLGGLFELFLGVRYLEFDEGFFVEGVGGILDESLWFTQADNHIVGPQVGVRWFRRQNRWTVSAEARYFSGYNSQSINQRAILGSNLAPTAPPTPGQPVKLTSTIRTETEDNLDEWTHNAELRVQVRYQLTRAIGLRVGWSQLWLDNIARPSNMVDYSLRGDGSIMGIVEARNKQDVFLRGLNVGITLNR